MAIGAVARLLRQLNRSLRVGGITKSTRAKAAQKVARKGREKKKLSVRVDTLPEVQAAVRAAGPGAKVISAKVVKGTETSREVLQQTRAEVRLPTHKFLRETPISAKGRLRKSVYNRWYAQQVIAAKLYADNMRRRLGRKLGRIPTKKEMQSALRKEPFVSKPLPAGGNIVETRAVLKEVVPDIPLAPLKLTNTVQARKAILALPEDQYVAFQNRLPKGKQRVAFIDVMTDPKKNFDKKQLDWLGTQLASAQKATPAPPPPPKQVADIRRRVARAEERIQTGTEQVSPAEFGVVTRTKRQAAAVEVEIQDAAGNITTKRIPIGAVVASDPAVRRHVTRVGKRKQAARLERPTFGAKGEQLKPLGPVDQQGRGPQPPTSTMDLIDDMAEGLEGVGLETQRGGIGGWAARNPTLATLGALEIGLIGGPMVAGLGGGFVQDFTGENPVDPTQSQSYILSQHRRLVNREAHHQQEMMQLQKLMAQNMGRLAAVAPQIYNQILAGQQIPQGAVVIGGQPRTDLMERLAYDMSTGGFKSQQGQEAMLQSFAQM